MTSWKPIDYKLPGSDEAWEKEFNNYKEFPEYKLANRNMDLAAFKKIFFVEWAHRLWGSSLGVLFGVPLAAFAALGTFRRRSGGQQLQSNTLSLDRLVEATDAYSSWRDVGFRRTARTHRMVDGEEWAEGEAGLSEPS